MPHAADVLAMCHIICVLHELVMELFQQDSAFIQNSNSVHAVKLTKPRKHNNHNNKGVYFFVAVLNNTDHLL